MTKIGGLSGVECNDEQAFTSFDAEGVREGSVFLFTNASDFDKRMKT